MLSIVRVRRSYILCLALLSVVGCNLTPEHQRWSSVGAAIDKDIVFDEDLARQTAKSSDLSADIKHMWKTVPNRDFPVSPVSAINAASRVFETIQLTGKTTNEVFALLGHNKRSSNSGYNFPFFPIADGTVAYRFDCGNFGWQFNLLTDSSGKVRKVERKWIH